MTTIARTPSRSAAIEPFKPHGIKVAEAAHLKMLNGPGEPLDEEALAAIRIAEISQWKHSVCDLHRVLNVAQAMFLLLEHHNEALLRVAIEIVCDQVSSGVLWWTEEWYSDEERRQWFRDLVMRLLAQCSAAQGVEVEQDTTGQDKLKEDLEKALERLSQAEASQKALEQKNSLLEAQLKDFEARLKESESEKKELQKAIERLSGKRDAPLDSHGAEEELRQKLAALEGKLKTAEQEKAMLKEQLEKAKSGTAGVDSSDEVAAMKAKMAELEQQLKDEHEKAVAAEKKAAAALKEAEKLKADLAKAKSGAKVQKVKADGGHDSDHEAAELRDALDAEKQRADQMASDNDRLKAELERLKADNKRLRDAPPKEIIVEKESPHHARSSDDSPSAAKRQVHHEDETPNSRARREKEEQQPQNQDAGPRTGPSQTDYDALMRELEKAQAKIAAQKATIGELKQKNEDLETRNDKMLKMLHQLKEQLRKVTEIAEKRGCGDLVRSILEEAGTTATLESDEFTCFDRLYEDAKRRMEKQRLWLEERMGLRPKSPQRSFGGANIQTWSGAGGGYGAPMSAPMSGGYGGYGGYGGGQGGGYSSGSRPNSLDRSNSFPAAQAPTHDGQSGSMHGGAMTISNPAAFASMNMAPPGGVMRVPTQFFSDPANPHSMPIPVSSSPLQQVAQSWASDNGDSLSGSLQVSGNSVLSRPVSSASRPASSMSFSPSSPMDSRVASPKDLGGTLDLRGSSPLDLRLGTPKRQLLGAGLSQSMGSFPAPSAMALDVHSLSGSLNQERLSSSGGFRRKLIESKSVGNFGDGLTSAPSFEDGGSPVLANSKIWSGHGNGQFSDRQAGPGMFRGFKLVSQSRPQRRLSPVRGGSQFASTISTADDIFQKKFPTLLNEKTSLLQHSKTTGMNEGVEF